MASKIQIILKIMNNILKANKNLEELVILMK